MTTKKYIPGLTLKFRSKYVLVFLLVTILTSSLKAQTLDQQQLIYNGGMSARTLTGYSEWQSFTAGLTGTLCQVNMGFFNYINGSGTLKIFSGTGTGGTLRQSKAVSVYCASGNCMICFSTSVPVVAGQVYTFQFLPGAGIPDPYGVQVQVPGTYGGGLMGLVDPSGTYPLTFDIVFQTFVNTTPLPVELLYFSGEPINGINHLEWSTATEINNDYFIVERSKDGIEFENIESVKGNGNSTQTLNYNYDDKFPLQGINYYRLKQVDYNGAFSYTRVIAIRNRSMKNFAWIHSTEEPGIYILHFNDMKSGSLKITDMRGQILLNTGIQCLGNEMKLDMRSYAEGILIISLNTGEEVYNLKVFKH